jgi:hypothetical protein
MMNRRFEVPAAAEIWIVVCWVMSARNFVGGNHKGDNKKLTDVFPSKTT